MNRIKEIEQEILELAQQEGRHFLGSYGKWARIIIQKWENITDSQERWTILRGIFDFDYEDDQEGEISFSRNALSPMIKLISEWEGLWVAQSKDQKLATERESTQQALTTSQEWHERQKREITEAKDLEIAQWKNKHQNYLNQRKSTIQQEITLIKEILWN